MALSDERLDAMRQADNGALNFVTRRQFRAVARAIEAEARRDALEEAAKVADSMAPEFGEKGWAAKDRGDLSLSLGMLGVEFQLKTCAQSIRALKETIQ